MKFGATGICRPDFSQDAAERFWTPEASPVPFPHLASKIHIAGGQRRLQEGRAGSSGGTKRDAAHSDVLMRSLCARWGRGEDFQGRCAEGGRARAAAGGTLGAATDGAAMDGAATDGAATDGAATDGAAICPLSSDAERV